ncbi:4212_t:CDS:2, partial [Racocetra persica]
HAPQYPNAGIGMDLPLLDWLNKYTYPLEKKFLSIEFTKKIYPIVVNQLLRCGTTTAIYYATIHLESSKYLADLVHQKGQRGFIGKVNMDRNNPHGYFETMESSVRYTVQFVKYIQSLESSLITPIITPRSALCCTSDLMKSLGDIAKDYQIPIQSHLSENLAEIDEVKRSYPHLPDYTTVYDHYNVLQNNRTIMAHCIYLSSQERKLIKERNVGISHCPNSNFTLSSGVCNVRQLLDEGIKVGLGTDISGGFSKSILDSIRSASIASRVIYFSSMKSDKVYNPLTISELTYLATMGAEGSPIQIFDDIDTNFEKIFEKFLFLGDDRNIKAVYVKGRKVSGTDITNLEA